MLYGLLLSQYLYVVLVVYVGYNTSGDHATPLYRIGTTIISCCVVLCWHAYHGVWCIVGYITTGDHATLLVLLVYPMYTIILGACTSYVLVVCGDATLAVGVLARFPTTESMEAVKGVEVTGGIIPMLVTP